MSKKKFSISLYKVIVLTYLSIILIGGFLLMTPIANKSGQWYVSLDPFFTATSATCVTGLTMVDTFSNWTFFGQLVLLLLIQVGGVGFMTFISLILILSGRKITIHQRLLIGAAVGSLDNNGIIKLVKRILQFTLCFELGGAILLFIGCQNYSLYGVWQAIFHSISAFCNAGFDLLGGTSAGEFSSFAYYSDNYFVLIVLMILIISGGLGFVVWQDLYKNKFRFKKLQLHSKIVLIASLSLIVVPTFLYYLFEHGKIDFINALFQSVTTRTAGFATFDQSTLSNSSYVMTCILMLIGGSPGSTAGGIKTTTIVVLFLSILESTSEDEDVKIGHSSLNHIAIYRAAAIVSLYILCSIFALLVICGVETGMNTPEGLRSIMYEVFSSIGTVGLGCNFTSCIGATSIHVVSKIMIMILMFIGRVGAMTLLYFINTKNTDYIKYRRDNVMIG